MNISGIKRGLAVSAISALAVAGLPQLATSASAESINDQIGAGQVVLFNSDATPLSVKPDGTDSTARLEAGAGADISQVTFQYQLAGGTPQTINTVSRNDDGAFSFEWAIPASLLGTTVTIIATGTPTTGPVATDDATGVVLAPAGAAVESYNLTAGSAKGVFAAPYAGATGQFIGLTGTASAAGPVTLAVADGTGFPIVGAGTAAPIVAPATTTTFKGVLDITGYDFAGAPDEIVTAVGNGASSQDFEAYTLYNQVITTVTATATATNVPAGGTTPVTVTVLDQSNNPIAGAEVRSSATGNPLVGYTDGDGRVSTTQGAGTVFYYANATDADEYAVIQGDQRSANVAVTEFTPVITTLDAVSEDGAAYDDDEYLSGDVYLQAKDQTGAVINADGREVNYYWTVTPFNGSAAVRVPTTSTTASLESGTGRFVVEVPIAQASGTYELFAGLADVPATPADESTPIVSKAVHKVGQASITFDETSPESAPAGTEEVVDGQVVLEDGTGLGGRSVEVTYDNGTGDANIVPATGNVLVSSRTVTTAADGSFSVTIDDPATTPQANELGGTLTADVVPGTSDNDDPLTTPAVQGVVFTSDVAPAGTTVDIADFTVEYKPGEVVPGTGVATAPDNTNDTDPVTPGTQGDADNLRDVVAGQQITLTIPAASGAYFTNGTPAPAPVIGADAGTFNDLGKSIVVTTDAAGAFSFELAIGRDAGFDDDGEVSVTLTAAAGAAAGSPSTTEAVDFDSAFPLNGSAVELVKSPASEQEGGTTPAETGQDVFYDIYTRDQFGNLVGGESVDIDLTATDDDTTIFFPGGTTSDFDDDGDFSVTALDPDTATLVATWDADTTRYTTNTGDGAPVTINDNEEFTDTESVTFVARTLAVTLTGNPETTATVGTAVTETFTVVDQDGDPVSGEPVTFTRVGPNGQTETVNRVTNANGVATYVFTGTAAGTATITAEVTEDESITASATDTIEFTATPEDVATNFTITSSPEGPVAIGAIVVETVTVTDAEGDGFAGATVRFTRSDTGESVERTTNSAGQATFSVSSSSAGTVNITAVIDYNTGTETLTDAITFAKSAIAVTISGGSVGSNDSLIVRTSSLAAGADVIVYKKIGNRIGRAGVGTLNSLGRFAVSTKDTNGRTAITYFAVVAETEDTLAGRAPAIRVL